MNKEISENLKEALENLQWCQTNVLYYEINNDKARELYKYIQELLCDKLGTKVRIRGSKIEINFSDLNDFNRIIDILKISE